MAKNKILVTFGRPNTGKSMLYLLHILFGKDLKKSEIIASHFERESETIYDENKNSMDVFLPLRQEAHRLDVNIEEYYSITDELINDITNLAYFEHVDFLFIGAGKHFLREHLVKEMYCDNKRSAFSNFLCNLRSNSYEMTGPLHRDKIEAMVEHLKCRVGIFVNRDFTTLNECCVVINNYCDNFLLEYALEMIQAGVKINISYAQNEIEEEGLRKNVEELLSLYPDKVKLEKPVWVCENLKGNDKLILTSYQTATLLAEDHEFFGELPSLLIMWNKFQEQ